MKMTAVVRGSLLAVLLLAGVFVTGCATPPPADWSSRVGHYTYAQAVHELGPPNRRSELSSGTTVFKWFGPPYGTPEVVANRPYGGLDNGFGASQPIRPNFGDHYLQLSFDTNGVLRAWSKH